MQYSGPIKWRDCGKNTEGSTTGNELNTVTPRFALRILKWNHQPIKLFEAKDCKSVMQLARRRALNKLTAQALLIRAELPGLEIKNVFSCIWQIDRRTEKQYEQYLILSFLI